MARKLEPARIARLKRLHAMVCPLAAEPPHTGAVVEVTCGRCEDLAALARVSPC